MGETGLSQRQPAPTGADFRFELLGIHPPTLRAREQGKPEYLAIGAWRFPAGIYLLSIMDPGGAAKDERRILLGDRRQRRREVDADSLCYHQRHI